MRVPIKVIRLAFIACLFVAPVCNADTLGTVPIPPNLFVTGFGSLEVYAGETFRLPSGPAAQANSLTVFVGPTTDPGASFRVLVTDVDTSTGFHPTKVIFESGTLNVPVFPLRSTPDKFVVDLGGLPLQPQHDYAWILDYFVVGNPSSYVSMGIGLGSYPDGAAFYFLNGAFSPAGTRQNQFASNNWFVAQDRDFAFDLNFTQGTEDSSVVFSNLDRSTITGAYSVGLYVPPPPFDSSYALGFPFTPSDDYRLTSISALTALATGMNQINDLVISLYTDVTVTGAGLLDPPGAPLESWSPVNELGPTCGVVTVDSHKHIKLRKGITYWLVLSMAVPSSTGYWCVNQTGQNNPSPEAASINGGPWSVSILPTAAFEIRGERRDRDDHWDHRKD